MAFIFHQLKMAFCNPSTVKSQRVRTLGVGERDREEGKNPFAPNVSSFLNKWRGCNRRENKLQKLSCEKSNYEIKLIFCPLIMDVEMASTAQEAQEKGGHTERGKGRPMLSKVETSRGGRGGTRN